jgi:hypothetical protein
LVDPEQQFLLFPFTFITISITQNLEYKVALILRFTFVCFQKVGLLYRWVGAGAASQFFTLSRSRIKMMRHRNTALQRCMQRNVTSTQQMINANVFSLKSLGMAYGYNGD